MPTSARIWLQHHLPRSRTPRTWYERLAWTFLLAGAGSTWYFADSLQPAHLAGVVSGLLLLFALLLRPTWGKLVGPLLPYEFVRAARSSRFVLLRLYIYFVLILGALVYVFWAGTGKQTEFAGREAADVAEGFFYFFMGTQSLFLLLLVPGFVASALTDEKERRTLEFLLATDLRNREIVLSKLLVRLANLALMVLTGLPILCLLQFLGGIELDFVLAGFAATFLTMLSLASLSILNSVYAKRSRDAIVYTYLQIASYFVLSVLLPFLPIGVLALGGSIGPVSLSVVEVVSWLGAGNPFHVLYTLGQSLASGGNLSLVLPPVLQDYALFHVLVALLCTSWASFRLRAVFLAQAYGQPRRQSWTARFGGGRRVWERPMLWKELRAEPGLRFGWMGKAVLLVLVAGSFAPAVYLESWRGWISPEELRVSFGVWTRVMGSMVACLMLIAVAVRAATAISGERERLTFDSLLTSPLESREMLVAKGLGCLLSVRWGWLWLALIWSWGIVEAQPSLVALPLFVLAWLVYAALLVTAGLWFSLFCRNNSRALVCTLLTTGSLGFGFLVLPVYSHTALRAGLVDSWIEWLTRFQLGLAPPLVLGRLLPFWDVDTLAGFRGEREAWEGPFAFLGLVCWAVAALIWWVVTYMAFQRATGRQTVRRPEQVLMVTAEPDPLREASLLERIPIAIKGGAASNAGKLELKPPTK